jgi:predicted CXXCH cytochrome family protein
MSGAAGVEPFWTDEGPPDFYGWLPTVQREYQVCLKCHSSFTELPDYAPDGWNGETYVADGLAKLTHLNPDQVLDSRDLAREFNPYNASFHPVITIGRNQMISSESFVPGWSVDSIAYCTDCHDNPVNSDGGPHGSPRLHLLDGGAEYQTLVREGTPPSPAMICFKCHAAEVYLDLDNPSTNFFRTHGAGRNLHGVHMAWGATCYACHDSHGSEQEHLLNFNLADDIHPTAGYNSQTAWFAVEEQSGCALVCHGKMHNGHVSQVYRYP